MSIAAVFVSWLALQQSWQLATSQFPGIDHWRIVRRDGFVLALDGPWPEAAGPGDGVVAIWHWSAVTAPRRILPEDLAKALREGAAPTKEFRVVRRAAEPPTPASGNPDASPPEPPGILIAGSAELWAEVPENLLPRYFWSPRRPTIEIPSPHDEDWRLRLVQGHRGSYWVEVPRGSKKVEITLAEAPDLDVQVVDSAGRSLADASLLVWRPSRAFGLRLAARYQSADGALVLPRLPDQEEGQFFFSASGHLTFGLRSLPSALPRLIELARGAQLRGRLIQADGEVAAGVELIAQSWLEESTSGYRLGKTRSGADGAFEFHSLPPGALNLRTAIADAGTFSADLTLPEDGLDVGDIVLLPPTSFPVRVVDSEGRPIRGARIQHEGKETFSDEGGEAWVVGVDARQKVQLFVEAAFHLPAGARFEPPHDALREIRLESAFLVRGQFVDANGAPVTRGRNVVTCGHSQSPGTLGPGGELEKLVPVGKACLLRLFSADTPELEVELAKGTPYEVRDLGVLQATKARRAVGQLVREDDHRPVAGAHLWLPRPHLGQEGLAQLQGDFVETTSDADGHFELTGLPTASARLRIEAAGLARVELDLPAASTEGDEDRGDLDLGIVELSPGALVSVRAPGLEDGALARLDRRGEWQDLDLLQATVVQDEAIFPQVSSGAYLLTILDRGKLRCEKWVEVPAGGELMVECPAEPIRIWGRVLLGGRPAPGGQLLFLTPAEEMSPAIIHHQLAPGGQKRARVHGGGRPQVDVEVASDGSFETTDLLPGAWLVCYQRGGSVSATQSVQVPEGSELFLELTFAQARVGGIVVDLAGRPVEGAFVRENPHGQVARTDQGGYFLFENATPGRSAFQADSGGQRSNILELEVTANSEAIGLELVLGREDRRGELKASVTWAGRRRSGDWLLLETDDGRKELAATNANGEASFNLQQPLPANLRLAAAAEGHLIFGDWQTLSAALEKSPTLQPPNSGAIEFPAFERQLPLLVDNQGWDISFWLGRLGRRPITDPQSPIVVEGLPPGRYRVSFGGREQFLDVRAGETSVVELP